MPINFREGLMIAACSMTTVVWHSHTCYWTEYWSDWQTASNKLSDSPISWLERGSEMESWMKIGCDFLRWNGEVFPQCCMKRNIEGSDISLEQSAFCLSDIVEVLGSEDPSTTCTKHLTRSQLQRAVDDRKIAFRRLLAANIGKSPWLVIEKTYRLSSSLSASPSKPLLWLALIMYFRDVAKDDHVF